MLVVDEVLDVELLDVELLDVELLETVKPVEASVLDVGVRGIDWLDDEVGSTVVGAAPTPSCAV